MHPTYSLTLILWSIYSTFAAPVPGTSTTLRAGGGAYTVDVEAGGMYYVYTPDYEKGGVAVTELKFPDENKEELIIYHAWNNREGRHKNGSPHLRLSDVIQAVATEIAQVDLGSLAWVKVDSVVHRGTADVVERFFAEWRKSNQKPTNAPRPRRITIKPSNEYWPIFQNTAFVKAVNYAVATTRKSTRLNSTVRRYFKGVAITTNHKTDIDEVFLSEARHRQTPFTYRLLVPLVAFTQSFNSTRPAARAPRPIGNLLRN
ncbi:hypothetical protein LZ30DRAFT_775515 [Colletotrichum cereale]|nr:hypothetical protein LZ30DRAFT_775515 [Colletotrichum cereale]